MNLLNDIEYTDLTGDKVYDHLVSRCHPDWAVVGGNIQPNRSFGPAEPRCLIHILLKNKRTGKLFVTSENYKKIIRDEGL